MYVCYKQFIGKTFQGLDVKIGKSQVLNEYKDYLVTKDDIICHKDSQVSHEHFASNYDGNGRQRGKLVGTILKVLKPESKEETVKASVFLISIKDWDKEGKYMNDSYNFTREFYKAKIEDLKEILSLYEGD